MQTRLRSATASPIAAWTPVLAGTVALLWLALVNGFPLLYYDSGAYLASAFNRLVPQVDRPIVSWLVHLCDRRQREPWLVIVAQSAIAAWVMHKALRVVDPALTPALKRCAFSALRRCRALPCMRTRCRPTSSPACWRWPIFVLVAGYRVLANAERWVLFALIAAASAATRRMRRSRRRR
jgi:hypothetical protein